MEHFKNSWLIREKAFAAFATGPLLDFWKQREECWFTGVDNIAIRYVRLTSADHTKAIVICPGRIESYVKYPELAWDLFHCGYDIFIIDHRGQGRSGRLLSDTHRGHVVSFDDYVTDLKTFYQREIAPRAYYARYALAHSMGGAILTKMLLRQPQAFDAVVLTAPMFGIQLPMPGWLARSILNMAEQCPVLRDSYALGTGSWRIRPFALNDLTHSRERYRRSVRFYADEPALQVGGPTYHWVRESLQAGQEIVHQAAAVSTPLLLLQAGEDEVVDNRAQDLFCQTMTAAGQPCAGGRPEVITGARHEIFFEKDRMRAEALEKTVNFFSGCPPVSPA